MFYPFVKSPVQIHLASQEFFSQRIIRHFKLHCFLLNIKLLKGKSK